MNTKYYIIQAPNICTIMNIFNDISWIVLKFLNYYFFAQKANFDAGEVFFVLLEKKVTYIQISVSLHNFP